MDEDDGVWEGAVKDVKPLRGVRKQPIKKDKLSKRKTLLQVGALAETDVFVRPAARTGHEMDRRTQDKLQNGLIKIEARIDLHGYKLADAEQALRAFIVRAYAQKMRCVLVITGKGKSAADQDWFEISGGTIREHTPRWLAAPAINAMILKTHLSQRKHGGDGALYVYLRRQRDR